MKSKENLVFLGMMGSGKSSIGSIVSKKLESFFGTAKNPTLQPPAPHHLLNPELTIVFSGFFDKIKLKYFQIEF